MPMERCHMALRQTLDLIALTDETLHDLSRRKFSSEELYHEVLGKLLGGSGRRGPSGILIATAGPGSRCCTGRVYHLRHGELIESSELIAIDPDSSYGISLLQLNADTNVVAVNWKEMTGSVDKFQTFFHPKVAEAMGEQILNFVCCRISGESIGIIEAFNYPGHATQYDADVLRSAAVVMGSLVTVSNEMQETERAFAYTIEALARACEAAEEDTGRHILRVNKYSGALAANMGFSVAFVEEMSVSAQMHDVGKIKIPVSILLKEGPLSASEMQMMHQHPVYGAQILGDSPRLKVAREIALSHHENWDGTGYPERLKGEAIPVSGRIAKIADVYDAMRSRRSYKRPMTHEEALRVFREGDEKVSPTHFDPAVLAAFFKIEHMFELIYDSSVPRLGMERRER